INADITRRFMCPPEKRAECAKWPWLETFSVAAIEVGHRSTSRKARAAGFMSKRRADHATPDALRELVEGAGVGRALKNERWRRPIQPKKMSPLVGKIRGLPGKGDNRSRRVLLVLMGI